jgi:3-oxoadipate enol-lactonase
VLTIDLDGLSIGYCVDGPSDAPVVLFSNGLATTADMWMPQAAFFSKRFRVLRYDVRGHGRTASSPHPYKLELLADDALHLMDHLGVERAAFVGLSLGGMIGQCFAVRHARRLGPLVLCDTTMKSRGAMWQERIAAVQREGLEPQVEPSIDRWFTRDFRARDPDAVARLRGMIQRTSIDGYLGCSMAMRDMRIAETAARITAPTLIVVGAHDPSTPFNDAQEMQAAIPGAQLAIIPRSAHLPNVEQPEIFNSVVGNFLNTHPWTS